eukprot:TRINITY_DN80282_c0_g1_i1.p1 TRINITY_DN80282_c0_g1~~TRINITY_DN80282_c0_g1_i1.p1  ORF type:complete len:689 (-),score=215.11 TRINITY_DN80282_c0_g1_i1:250-2316(-)
MDIACHTNDPYEDGGLYNFGVVCGFILVAVCIIRFVRSAVRVVDIRAAVRSGNVVEMDSSEAYLFGENAAAQAVIEQQLRKKAEKPPVLMRHASIPVFVPKSSVLFKEGRVSQSVTQKEVEKLRDESNANTVMREGMGMRKGQFTRIVEEEHASVHFMAQGPSGLGGRVKFRVLWGVPLEGIFLWNSVQNPWEDVVIPITREMGSLEGDKGPHTHKAQETEAPSKLRQWFSRVFSRQHGKHVRLENEEDESETDHEKVNEMSSFDGESGPREVGDDDGHVDEESGFLGPQGVRSDAEAVHLDEREVGPHSMEEIPLQEIGRYSTRDDVAAGSSPHIRDKVRMDTKAALLNSWNGLHCRGIPCLAVSPWRTLGRDDAFGLPERDDAPGSSRSENSDGPDRKESIGHCGNGGEGKDEVSSEEDMIEQDEFSDHSKSYRTAQEDIFDAERCVSMDQYYAECHNSNTFWCVVLAEWDMREMHYQAKCASRGQGSPIGPHEERETGQKMDDCDLLSTIVCIGPSGILGQFLAWNGQMYEVMEIYGIEELRRVSSIISDIGSSFTTGVASRGPFVIAKRDTEERVEMEDQMSEKSGKSDHPSLHKSASPASPGSASSSSSRLPPVPHDDVPHDEEDDDASSEGNECLVCLSSEKRVLMYPCRHFCCCLVCSMQLDKCPVCRADVLGYVVFRDLD